MLFSRFFESQSYPGGGTSALSRLDIYLGLPMHVTACTYGPKTLSHRLLVLFGGLLILAPDDPSLHHHNEVLRGRLCCYIVCLAVVSARHLQMCLTMLICRFYELMHGTQIGQVPLISIHRSRDRWMGTIAMELGIHHPDGEGDIAGSSFCGVSRGGGGNNSLG